MKRVNDKKAVSSGRSGAKTVLYTAGLLALLTGSYLILPVPVFSEAPPGTELSFAVVGDLMGHDEQIQSAYDPECKCYDYSSVFEDTAPIIRKADLAIGNLEVTLPGKKEKYKGYPLFGSPDAYAEAMKEAGFDILTLANNHTVDTGREGVLRTHRIVHKLGLIGLGVYASDQDYRKNRIPVIEKNGFRIAMLNYTYGTNGIPVPPGLRINHIHPMRIREDLMLAERMNVDIKMVLFHFGQEYTREPNNYQKQMVDIAVDAGADIVIGGHPHVLQPYERRYVKAPEAPGGMRPVLIAYSLGNFVSHQIRRYTDGGMIFQFTVVKRDGGLEIKAIGYEPVLVYIDRSGKRSQYRVLPVNDYLHYRDGKLHRKPKPPRELSKAGWSRMTVFFRDTTLHLARSRENASP